MRLFLIDKPKCRHISEIVKGVSAVYQLEQEFYPYLLVDFLPNKNNEPGGVIIQVGKEIIKKNYTFEIPNDLINLRKLLWKLLHKYHNPIDITDKNGCLKDFRKTSTNKIIQGWQAKKKTMREDVCCKIIKNVIANDFTNFMIKHWYYRDPTTNKIDNNTCKKIRWQECGNNYPPNSMTFKRCVDEVEWLCNKGYDKNNKNKIIDEKNKMIANIHKKIYDYLDKNNLKVNKQIFDSIINAGLFDNVGNRMGNKSINFYNISNTLDKIMHEKQNYLKIIESFNNKSNYQLIINYVTILCIIMTIIFLIILF